MWLALSLTHGGLRASWSDAWGHPGPAVAQDARLPWRGPYFEALEALAALLHRGDTVAVVLAEGDRPGQPKSIGPPTRVYETIYRLYPVRPDFYFRSWEGSYKPWLFERRTGEAPEATGLWDHGTVLWAAGSEPRPLVRGQAIWSNSAATVYRER